MATNMDGMIDISNKIRKLVLEYQALLERFENGAISGPYLTRPVYADEFRTIAREAREIEGLCLEAVRYFGSEIAQAKKTPERLRLSSVQQSHLVDFLEMMKQPLFPLLADAQYRHPGLSAQSIRPDC